MYEIYKCDLNGGVCPRSCQDCFNCKPIAMPMDLIEEEEGMGEIEIEELEFENEKKKTTLSTCNAIIQRCKTSNI